MKKVVTIQDISCFGKCSLTVALPIISAMGIETAVIPTAVLSTHTGGFKGYTFRDLTSDIPGIAAHWKSLGLSFDAVYTGYLGSVQQVQIVADFFRDFSTPDNFIVVDPVMGDNGRMYAGFTGEFVAEMRRLCSLADHIIPNMTEAALLLDIPYKEEQSAEDVRDILKRLAELGCRTPVLTGVRSPEGGHGAAAYQAETGEFFYAFREHVDHTVHGTGDIFASVFTGAAALGKSLEQSLNIAVNFTADCVHETIGHFDEVWYGSYFEPCLGRLIEYVKE